MIKPDAVKNKYIGNIFTIIENNGYGIVEIIGINAMHGSNSKESFSRKCTLIFPDFDADKKKG
ncbi:hypothetical protein KAU11_01670 [Candidatus Babeliales bacterium]|nr:hypothetical protein [Candidatus Babeliales bacterium]